MTTQTTQTRYATTVGSVNKFRIDVACTDRGNLPNTSIFAISILDETDSKQDTFARVAAIVDFVDVKGSRSAALAADEFIYRTSSFTLYYDDLDVAVNAQTLLKEQIDALVSDYDTYVASFAATTETTVHPQLSTPIYEAAVTAYTDALQDTLDAQAARVVTAAALVDAQAAATRASTAQTLANAVYADATTVRGYYNQLKTSYEVLGGYDTAGDGKTFLDAAATYRLAKGADVAFDLAVTTFTTALQTSQNVKTDLTAKLSTIDGLLALRYAESVDAGTAKTNADAAVQAAVTADLAAQAAVTSAKVAEAAALDAVKLLKPDFDKTTVGGPSPA